MTSRQSFHLPIVAVGKRSCCLHCVTAGGTSFKLLFGEGTKVTIVTSE